MRERSHARGRSLRAHLVVFGLAIVLPVLVFAALLFGQVQGQERRRLEGMASTLAVNIATDINREVGRDSVMLRSLATNPNLRTGQYDALRDRARELGSLIGGRFVLSFDGPDGTLPAPGLLPGDEVSLTELRPGATPAEDSFALTLPLVRDGRREGQLALELPAHRMSELLAEEEVPRGWITAVHDGAGRRVGISPESASDADTRATPSANRVQRLPGGPAGSAPGDDDVVFWQSDDGSGKRSLVVSHPVASSQWTVSAIVPEASLNAPMQQSVALLAWLGLSLVLLSFLLAVYFGRRLATPIRQVTAAASSLSGGTLPALPQFQVREANDLVQALTTTADVLRQRSEALTRAHDELANVYDGSPVGMGLFGADGSIVRMNRAMTELELPRAGPDALDLAAWPDLRGLMDEVAASGTPVAGRDVILPGARPRIFRASAFPAGCPREPGHAIGISIEDVTERRAAEVALAESNQRIQRLLDANFFGIALVRNGAITEANDAFLAILGRPREDLAGGLGLDAVTSPDFHAADARALAEVRATGLCRAFEKDLLRSDGRRVPALVGYARLDLQPLSVICFALDLTEQRQRDTQRRYLMRELTHRTKNLLAVVQAMAVQTAKSSANPSDFHERFAARLQGLAGSHDLLVQENWAGASIRDLVRSQLGHYAEGIGTQIQLDGPALLLEPDAAQNLGMALHELSTNAAKYGALSVPEGHVRIAWTVEQGDGEAEPHLVVDWTERGGPTVVPPRRRGFGHVVMDRLAARALNGQVQMTFAPEGVSWRLRAPASITSPLAPAPETTSP